MPRYAYHKRLKSFRAYCNRLEIDLLTDDYRFIDKMLNIFPVSDFKAILDAYSKEWLLGMAKSESHSLEQGMGRKRANLWLLSKVSEINNEKGASTECNNAP